MDSDSTAWKYKQNVGISSEGPSICLEINSRRSTCMAVLQL
jgi:hypothetical protein